ncbi:MAG: 50S ribosomal protein L9 [Gammaproteobacteria bacterium]|nr:50S ribosomal protein L9 [Gammaproteobacteria bacterium]
MEIILLEKIRNLGALGDRVNVKSGYGRNFLIPKGKAAYVTEANIAKFEARRAELEKIAAEHVKAAETRKKALVALGVVTIIAKAGDEGKLFGSIGTRDIAEVITQAGVEIEKSEVDLPTGVLRHIGEYDIVIELHSDVKAAVKLSVVSDAKDEDQE